MKKEKNEEFLTKAQEALRARIGINQNLLRELRAFVASVRGFFHQ